MEWGYDLKIFEGEVFACPRERLLSAVDNKFSQQQSEGQVVESHNVLSMDDLKKLYQSPFLSTDSPHGFQERLIFDLSLVTAMRPSALWTLTLRQIKKTEVEGQTVWSVAGVIGSWIGASKTNRGGWNAVHDRPSEVCV